MKATHIPVISAVVFVFPAGCNTSTITSESPLDAFKSFAAKVETVLPTVLHDSKLSAPVSFDVQKTNSLVSPFTAHLTFSFSEPRSETNSHYLLARNVRADYAYQEGHWVCKGILISYTDAQFVSGDPVLFEISKKMWLATDPVKIEGTDLAFSEDEMVKLLRACFKTGSKYNECK